MYKYFLYLELQYSLFSLKMKNALLVFLLGVQIQTLWSLIHPSNAIDLHREWQAWKLKHGKQYSRRQGLQEEYFRKKIWLNNKDMIDRHNEQFDKVESCV